MYEGNKAELKMMRMILDEGCFDNKEHECEIVTYKPEEEQIYFLTESEDVPAFSLDGLYECEIKTQDSIIECNGMITERYWNKLGKVLVFRIKNGFYKKVLN